MSTATVSVDEFQALEQKVLLAVDLIRKERDARSAAEAERDNTLAELTQLRNELSSAQNELAATQQQLTELRSEANAAQTEANELRDRLATAAVAQTEVESLHREREAVRLRVEKMLSQIDGLL